ncbi:MAG: hypothetical protein M3313_13530 [Actinomycetota bacterium]|nr:hypothetical protein [Actinomycetota bacterium]
MPSQRDAGPEQGTAGGESAPNVWPNYQLPPDLVTGSPGSATSEPLSAPAVTGFPPHPPLGTHQPGPPTSSTRPQPLLVVGAAALALVVGVAVTLLLTQPWASSGETITGMTQAAPTPSYAAPTTSNRLQLAAADPGAALTQQAADDRSTIAEIPDGYWVPQLSSKRVGLVADGITYTEQAIWEDHYGIRSANPGAALLWSGDYTTFTYPDFWVTIIPAAYSSTAEDANQWCASRGFDADNCYAKRISATSYYDETTQHR